MPLFPNKEILIYWGLGLRHRLFMGHKWIHHRYSVKKKPPSFWCFHASQVPALEPTSVPRLLDILPRVLRAFTNIYAHMCSHSQMHTGHWHPRYSFHLVLTLQNFPYQSIWTFLFLEVAVVVNLFNWSPINRHLDRPPQSSITNNAAMYILGHTSFCMNVQIY